MFLTGRIEKPAAYPPYIPNDCFLIILESPHASMSYFVQPGNDKVKDFLAGVAGKRVDVTVVGAFEQRYHYFIARSAHVTADVIKKIEG